LTRPEAFPNIDPKLSPHASDSATTVGARLRAAREKQGISLREISDRTRISVVLLDALERDDIKRLPGGLFTRAFVRTYAKELNLDPKETVADFLVQFGQESVAIGAQGIPIEDNQAIESDRRMAETVVRLVLLSIPIAGIVIYFGLRQPPAPSSDVGAPQGPAEQAASEVKPTDPVKATAGAVQPSAIPASAGSTGVPQVSSPPPGVLTMVIAPPSDCWISAIIDGKRGPSELLRGGQRRALTALKEIVITLGDGAACTYTLNGAAGRQFGAPREVVTRRINLDNYRTFLMP
jgi:cytoskeleton protein RodZ